MREYQALIIDLDTITNPTKKMVDGWLLKKMDTRRPDKNLCIYKIVMTNAERKHFG